MAAGLAKAYMQTVDEHKRLVHAIQLERGCSCAFVGAGGTLEQFDALVRKHTITGELGPEVAFDAVANNFSAAVQQRMPGLVMRA